MIITSKLHLDMDMLTILTKAFTELFTKHKVFHKLQKIPRYRDMAQSHQIHQDNIATVLQMIIYSQFVVTSNSSYGYIFAEASMQILIKSTVNRQFSQIPNAPFPYSTIHHSE